MTGLLGAAMLMPVPAFARGASRGAGTTGLRLLMAERAGCSCCRRWHREIGAGFAGSAEGRGAPLMRVDADGPWPDGLALASAPRVWPTFILLRGGSEVGRLEGYGQAGDFYPALRRLLAAAS